MYIYPFFFGGFMAFKPINRNEINTNRILVDLEVMIDFDLAVVYYIIINIKDPSILKEDIGRANTLSGIRNVLLFRKNINPLSVCIKDEYADSIDDIYKELINNHEKEILDLCQVNDLYNYFKVLLMTDNLVSITVNCKNDLQLDIAQKILPTAKTVIDQRDLDKFDTLYLKYASDIIQYTNIKKKKIYFINGMYNYDNGMFKREILVLIDMNIVNTIDPYNNLTIPPIYNF